MARMKLLTCPICQGRIEVDLDTGIVYRHFEKKKPEEAQKDFDSAVDKVAHKDEKLQDLFSRAKEKEKNRDLEELFRKAKDKAKEDLGQQ